jgi:Carboxypeptidase regulatory-like domain
MVRILRFAAAFSFLWASLAAAQPQPAQAAPDWHGTAKMSGKVVDTAGKPIEGVSIKLILPAAKGGTEAVTDKKGEWKVEQIADGDWLVEFRKDGFDPRQIPVQVGGKVKEPHLEVKLTTEGTDPNFAVTDAVQRAKALEADKKFAEAALIFEQLAPKYPKVPKLIAMAAQYYDKAGDFSKSADALKKYVELEPGNVDIQMFLSLEYIKAKRYPEAWQMMSGVDPTKVTDPTYYMDAGYELLRAKQADEAYKYFDLVVTRFPPDKVPAVTNALYYRALAGWQSALNMGKDKQDSPEAKAKGEQAKADLNKFLEIAPDSKEAPMAKKLLEAIK